MSELITYKGGCHCGNIRFTAKLPDIRTTKIIRCNCSICTKNGYLLVYPKRTDFAFGSGEDKLSSYLMGSKTLPHKFCGQCGTSILIDFSQTDRKELGALKETAPVTVSRYSLRDTKDGLLMKLVRFGHLTRSRISSMSWSIRMLMEST